MNIHKSMIWYPHTKIQTNIQIDFSKIFNGMNVDMCLLKALNKKGC